MLRILIGLPVLLVLILFALSNQAEVTLALWPTDLSVQTPMAIAILAAAAFIIGALFTWFAGIGHRRRARRAESTIRLLEEQVAALKARPMTPAGTGLARLPER
jgi:uncharacterized integral membrane protein